MESLGIEGSDEETSRLQESLSLKAFLRVSKESRRDHLISTIETNITPIQSPERIMNSSAITSTARAVSSSFRSEQKTTSSSVHNNKNFFDKFNLTYDPSDVVASSPTRSPKSPLQSNDYFVDMSPNSSDECKLPVNQSSFMTSSEVEYLSDRDRSKVAENFNAMNTIINSTFKEKIDYQRKLRDQQSELSALKEKLQRLKEENSHLVKTISKNKQSNLPMTMARIHSKRRLARLRRALSRWQESARGCAVLHIQKVEQEFQKREAEYIHSGRIVVVKLRMSAFRSLGIIVTRRRKEFFRKAFSQWHVAISGAACLQLQRDFLATTCVSAVSKTHAKYRSFRVWRAQYTRRKVLRAVLGKRGSQDYKSTLRDALKTWRCVLKNYHHAGVIKACARTLLRHGPLADSFKRWRYSFCGSYYLRKVMVVKAINRRCHHVRVDFLRDSFTRWSGHTTRDQMRQQRMTSLVENIRRLHYRTALRRWQQGIEDKRRKQAMLLRAFENLSEKSLQSTKTLAFSRWLQFSLAVDRIRHKSALLDCEQQMQRSVEQASSESDAMLASQARDTRITLHCVKKVLQTMKILSCFQRRQHRMAIAFKRWSYLSVIGNSIRDTSVVCYTRRIVIIMQARLKEKRKNAFAKWKNEVTHINIQRKIIFRMLNSAHKHNVASAFRKWHDFVWTSNVQSLALQMQSVRAKGCLSRWLFLRLDIPFKKWKTVSTILTSRSKIISRMKKIMKKYYLKMGLQRWHRSTVVHDLLEQKVALAKRQTAGLNAIQRLVAVASDKCQLRTLLRWKLFTKHSNHIKRASIVQTKLTHRKVFKESFGRWSKVLRIRRKLKSGFRMLGTLLTGHTKSRVLKCFNHWTRVIASHTRDAHDTVFAQLQEKHHECMSALLVSQAKCSDATTTISKLTETNYLFERTIQKDEKIKTVFMFHLANKKCIHAAFSVWKERFRRFKSNSRTLVATARHCLNRLWSTCVRQRFNRWKLKVSCYQICSKVFTNLSHKWSKLQVQYAFRRWQHFSVKFYVAKISETVKIKYTEMDNQVTFHQLEKHKINLYIKYMNTWKLYRDMCLLKHQKLYKFVTSKIGSNLNESFQKWRKLHKYRSILGRAATVLLKARTFAGFHIWKRTHVKVRKLHGAVQHLQKWQRHSVRELCRRWKSYCRLVHIQRMVLRSVLLTKTKRLLNYTQRGFGKWKKLLIEARILDHKERYLVNRVRDRLVFGALRRWHEQCVERKTYRQTRETVVHGVSQALPVVKDVYDVLFSSESVEECIALATLSLEKILPAYQAEIYVMVSNTMLRASVPLKNSTNGTTSRFSSRLFDRDPRESPMDIPSSPILQQQQHMRGEISSPQGHLLHTSTGSQHFQSPWSADKTSASSRARGGHLFHTPYEHRHQQHEEERDNMEVVSVIVGRGVVGLCAKTGSYQVNRHVTSNTLSSSPDKQKQQRFADEYNRNMGQPSKDIVNIVVPLISSGCIVGVLQLSPISHGNHADTSVNRGDVMRPNSPVAFPYPSTASTSASFSYPYPPAPSHQASFGSYALPTSQTMSPSQFHSFSNSHFFKKSVAPLPPAQFTELVNMCMDVHISDIGTLSQLCTVVGTLSDALRMYITGNVKKVDVIAAAVAEKEQLESYISQLHGEVATFEETVVNSTKRIDHLEKSRLKYFNESKSFQDKAEAYERENEGLTRELGECKYQLEKFLDKKRSEGMVMDQLHRSLSKATIEVFGTPAAFSDQYIDDGDDNGVMGVRDLAASGPLSNELHRSTSFNTNTNSGGRAGNTSGYRSTEDSRYLSSSGAGGGGAGAGAGAGGGGGEGGGYNMRINTQTPLSRSGEYLQPNTNNTFTTYDSASRFSPSSAHTNRGR